MPKYVTSKDSIREFLKLLPTDAPSPDRLPKDLLPIEQLCDPTVEFGEVDAALSGWTPFDTDVVPVPALEGWFSLRDNWRMAAAVEEWSRMSNGRVEAREILFERRVKPADVTVEFIASLGCACLNRYSESHGEDLKTQFGPISPELAFHLLFHAASDCCAYGPGSGRAFGRYKALLSAAEMAGASSYEWTHVSDRALAANWYWFCANSDWFYTQAWAGFGLFTLRPDGLSAALLAAIDTD